MEGEGEQGRDTRTEPPAIGAHVYAFGACELCRTPIAAGTGGVWSVDTGPTTPTCRSCMSCTTASLRMCPFSQAPPLSRMQVSASANAAGKFISAKWHADLQQAEGLQG